jgi:phosphatidylglycerophosphatase A
VATTNTPDDLPPTGGAAPAPVPAPSPAPAGAGDVSPAPAAGSAPISPATPIASTAPPRLDRRFLFASPWHFIALGAGSGLPRFAPGTWGTLLGWALFALLDPFYSDLAWLGLIVAGLYFGAWAAQRTGTALGKVDSGHIVIDEIVAFWVVLLMLPDKVELQGLQHTIAFVLFRFFDIVKPPPIRWLDARIKNGIGVMLDDLVAAFFTLLVFALWLRLT